MLNPPLTTPYPKPFASTSTCAVQTDVFPLSYASTHTGKTTCIRTLYQMCSGVSSYAPLFLRTAMLTWSLNGVCAVRGKNMGVDNP